MNALSGLILIITATWVLLLAETFMLFGVIRPLGPNIHESASSAVLKIGATIVLGVVWVVVMFLARNLYVRRISPPRHGPV